MNFVTIQQTPSQTLFGAELASETEFRLQMRSQTGVWERGVTTAE